MFLEKPKRWLAKRKKMSASLEKRKTNLVGQEIILQS